jgi:hypothetical protein
MCNDMDDAVPWYQGIDLFVGTRRLGKEAYMISYNNDVHNPSSPREPEGHRDADATALLQQAEGTAGAGLDGHGIPAKDKGKDQVARPPGIIGP